MNRQQLCSVILVLCPIVAAVRTIEHVSCQRVDGRIVIQASRDGGHLRALLESLLLVDFGRDCVRVVVRVRVQMIGNARI